MRLDGVIAVSKNWQVPADRANFVNEAISDKIKIAISVSRSKFDLTGLHVIADVKENKSPVLGRFSV